jgi:hypothetical protein
MIRPAMDYLVGLPDLSGNESRFGERATVVCNWLTEIPLPDKSGQAM